MPVSVRLIKILIYVFSNMYFLLENLLATFPDFIFTVLYPMLYFVCTVVDCIDRNGEHLETKKQRKKLRGCKTGVQSEKYLCKSCKANLVWET